MRMYNKDVGINNLRNNNKEVLHLSKELFVRAEEVAGALGISKPYAYKLVREMNEELKQKGFPHHPRTGEQALLRGKILWTAGQSVRREQNASVQRQGQGNMVCVLLL